MTAYYGADYTTDSPARRCTRRGEVLCKRFTMIIAAAIVSTDTLTPVRMPADHRILEFTAYSPDLEDGNFVCEIGYTGNANGIATSATLGRAAGVQTFPGASTSTGEHLSDAAAPTSDYDILIDPTLVGTATAGPLTISGFVLYTMDSLEYDPTDGPAAVAGTQ